MTTALEVGQRSADPSDIEAVWQAGFSRHVPAYLIATTLTATTRPVPVPRTAEQIPMVALDAITTDARTATEEPQPYDAVATIIDWWMTEDEIGNFTLRSPCGRVVVAHIPEDRHDVQWQSPWTITATGDTVEGGDRRPLGSWSITFTEHTPYTVVGAVASAINSALHDLDILEVHDDFESSPEPSFTPHRRHRPDPVPGSRDPALAHARLRLLGWADSDTGRVRSSTGLGHGDDRFELRSGRRDEPASEYLLPPPETWRLEGGQLLTPWTATFDPGVPTFLVHAAAREAARLPPPSPPSLSAQPRLRAITRTEASRTTSPRTGSGAESGSGGPAHPTPPAGPTRRPR